MVTREFERRARVQGEHDPLWRQVAVSPLEDDAVEGFATDAVGDNQSQVVPGLLHKYHGRVLMIVTGACAIHCRYCFRRHYPYSSVPKAVGDWQPALQYIQEHAEIEEVILSGGDPWTVVDDKLKWLAQQFDAIPHLKRLRIHTRMPVVLPSRICDTLLGWLAASRLSKWVVIHSNHADELDEEVANALQRLRSIHVQLLNQSVLLSGVNDSVEALRNLSLRLLDLGVLPYYLHQLDRVQGAAHFEVPLQKGKDLMKALQAVLPGYAVPRFVSEIAGEPNKVSL